MTVWLLSHLIDSPGNRLFVGEAKRRGVSVRQVAPSSLSWCASGEGVDYLDEERPQVIFTRLGSSASESDLLAVRVAEAAGIPVLNSYDSLRLCRDKAKTYLSLVQAGVPIPDTMSLAPGWDPRAVEAQCGPPPHIVKLSRGTQGQGVMLSESWRSLTSLLEAMATLEAEVLVQRFLREAKGRDTRVLVIGGKARGAAVRQAQDPSEFRSNLHLGGQATVVDPTPRQIEVAEAAVATLELEVAGVDLLDSPAGPVVVEVNGSPGFEASPFFVKHVWDHLDQVYLAGRASLDPNAGGYGNYR